MALQGEQSYSPWVLGGRVLLRQCVLRSFSEGGGYGGDKLADGKGLPETTPKVSAANHCKLLAKAAYWLLLWK
jgi:hypothetical protein